MTAEPTPEPTADLETIVPFEPKLTIEDIEVRVKRLRLRETLALARVLSVGIGAGMLEADLTSDDLEQVKANILGMLMIALPSAVEETVQFFQIVLESVNKTDEKKLRAALQNPGLGDTFDVINKLLEQEAQTLLDVVGKAQAAANTMTKLLTDRKEKSTDG